MEQTVQEERVLNVSGDVSIAMGDRIQAMMLKAAADVVSSRWPEAIRLLWSVTNWLVAHIVCEGEAVDVSLAAWQCLNEAWLYFLCRTREEIQANAGEVPLITEAQLELLAREMIGWCDQLEKYGLVDYERGLWEERILEMMRHALTLLKAQRSTVVVARNSD
ncbi:uncharacterized protein T551_02647 [Pneumocystis jirovecii RU7]|uniref:Nuclear pore complex protein n=1 Tax=Pneumocystis jirovecii (strain RU7) TaxID=1408657 RepID=A0A0W4ZIP2_PNEJ7|nr:uncharacterized protein T551_02647 [Pneumocystis jirovecii RU7]KTW28228.1 hypothetical protein T551_02647 [Pneumocystis jirovecii RU7]